MQAVLTQFDLQHTTWTREKHFAVDVAFVVYYGSEAVVEVAVQQSNFLPHSGTDL